MDPCVRRSFLRYSQDLIFWTNKNRILENRSCEQAFKQKLNFLDHFKNLNDALKLWKCRCLTLANKVLIFKIFKNNMVLIFRTLALSKLLSACTVKVPDVIYQFNTLKDLYLK